MLDKMQVVRLDPKNADAARMVLGRAFHHYPLLEYAVSDSARRFRVSLTLYGSLLRDALRLGHVDTTPEVAGVACWLPPGIGPMTLLRQIRSGMASLPFHLGIAGTHKLVLYDNWSVRLHHQYAPEPHWYLLALGVDTHRQGQGVGSQLMTPQLQQADRDGIACYLDTHLERNVRLYQKHGFEVMWTGTPAGHPVPIWSMRREPK
jgi:ribosomal protein S18 acetylase RimI-like enzyme